MVDDDIVAVGAVIGGGDHLAGARGHHRRAVIAEAVDINTAVIAGLACKGIAAVSETARDPGAARQGPDEAALLRTGGVARLEDGTIAGSATNVYQCMLNAIEYGIPVETAVAAATITPAREIGADDLIGSIAVGKYADFVICDQALKPEKIFLGGEEV